MFSSYARFLMRLKFFIAVFFTSQHNIFLVVVVKYFTCISSCIFTLLYSVFKVLCKLTINRQFRELLPRLKPRILLRKTVILLVCNAFKLCFNLLFSDFASQNRNSCSLFSFPALMRITSSTEVSDLAFAKPQFLQFSALSCIALKLNFFGFGNLLPLAS